MADKRGADFVWMQISEPFFTWETTMNHREREERERNGFSSHW